MSPRRKSSAGGPASPRDEAGLLAEARHPDPPSFLGRHAAPRGIVLRVFSPRTRALSVSGGPALERVGSTDLFVWSGPAAQVPERYELAWTGDDGVVRRGFDAYACPPPAAIARS